MHIEYRTIDSEETAIGRLELRRFDTENGESGYEILVDGNFLMASHGSSSERAMAQIAYDNLGKSQTELGVLVGGLGAGHTLRAALDLPGVKKVTVAEISKKVVEWNHRYFSEANDSALDDPRVEVVIGDLFDMIWNQTSTFDLILLDVDNGPAWLASEKNQRLYEDETLRRCFRLISDSGVLAIWSPIPNPELLTRLELLFSTVKTETTYAASRQHAEPPSTIYLVRKT